MSIGISEPTKGKRKSKLKPKSLKVRGKSAGNKLRKKVRGKSSTRSRSKK